MIKTSFLSRQNIFIPHPNMAKKPAVLPVPAARWILVRSTDRQASGRSGHDRQAAGRILGFRWGIDLSESEARTGPCPDEHGGSGIHQAPCDDVSRIDLCPFPRRTPFTIVQKKEDNF